MSMNFTLAGRQIFKESNLNLRLFRLQANLNSIMNFKLRIMNNSYLKSLISIFNERVVFSLLFFSSLFLLFSPSPLRFGL